MITAAEIAVLTFDPDLPYEFSPTNRIGPGEREAMGRLRRTLEGIAERGDYRFTFFDDHEALIDELRKQTIDLALNFCDVGYRNDWQRVVHIPALLEMLGVPYTGSDPSAMSVATDKSAARALAQECGVLVPEEICVDLTASSWSLPAEYPVIIKPCFGAGSYGITADSVAHDGDEAERELRRLAAAGDLRYVTVQEYLPGDEYTVAVIGNGDDLEVLPPMVVDFSGLDDELPPLFTYDAKFEPDSPYYRAIGHCRAELSDEGRDGLMGDCRSLFKRFGFRDYARLDFRCDAQGRAKFIDANPNPTWYAESRLASAARWVGYDYPHLIIRIIELARSRSRAATNGGAS